MKRSILLTLAAGLVALTFGAADAKAGGVTLASLLGGGSITATGNGYSFKFSDFAYNPSASDPTAANILVAPQLYATDLPITGAPASTGLSFTATTGSFGGPSVNLLSYEVTILAPSPGILQDAVLYANFVAGVAGSTATMDQYIAGGYANQVQGGGHTTYAGAVATDLAATSPVSALTSLSVSTSGGEKISSFSQTFTASSVPEPASMALMGIGLAGCLALRRILNRPSRP